MDRLREETATGEGTDAFERLQPYLTGSEPRVPYREVAGELGTSEGAVKSAVHRFRQRYGRLLRDEIASTLAQPEDGAQVDDELRHLLAGVHPWEGAAE